MTLNPGKNMNGTASSLNQGLFVIDLDRLGSSSPNIIPYNSKFATANAIVNTIPANTTKTISSLPIKL